MKLSLVEQIHLRCIPVPESGCWLWLGATFKTGYAMWNIEGHTKRAHRVIYEALVGPIPDGAVTDHTCRVRCCVNPSHIELVTNKINVLRGIGSTAVNARKTHCKRGHELAGSNVYRYINRFGRECRQCRATARNKTLIQEPSP